MNAPQKFLKVVFVVCLALCLMLPVFMWLKYTGNPVDYLGYVLPPGQALYIFAKLCALLGLSVFMVQIILGVARKVSFLQEYSVSIRAHQWMGLSALLLISLHVLLFTTATSLRAGHLNWPILLPDFTHGYYRSMVSIGAIALFLLLVSVLCGWFLRQPKTKYRSWLKAAHMLVFLSMILSFIHAFSIGTETRSWGMIFLLSSMSLALLLSLFFRIKK